MTDSINAVIGRLKSYSTMKRRLEQLCFELDNLPVVNECDFIESLALGIRPDGQGYRHGGHPSDKTMAIALQYKNIMRECENDSYMEIRRELRLLEAEVHRLEYYVSLLVNHEMDAIRSLFFEQKTWDEAAQQLSISRQTLSRHRNSAIRELAAMYATINGGTCHEGIARPV